MAKNRSFDENYPVKDSYRRFDQRQSAFGRRLKRTGRIVNFGDDEDRAKRINQGLPGYSLVDYAFNSAAGMYETLPGEQDSQGTGFYSWGPLGVAQKPEGVPRWEGTPEKAAKIVTKASKYFGAAGVGFTGLDKRWV